MTPCSRNQIDTTRFLGTRILAAVVISSLLCSCQSLHAPNAPQVARPRPEQEIGTAPPLTASVRPAGRSRVTDAASRPPSPAPPAQPVIAQATHAGPSAAPGFAHGGPWSSLGTTTCGCGRAPHGLCACAQGGYGETIHSPNEYLCNGGDRETGVLVKGDWSVHGLHAGDTIAHFDTVDGELKVTHSNELCIYAPRFAAIRHVAGVVQHEQHLRGAGVEIASGVVAHQDRRSPSTVNQPLQPQRHLMVAGPQRLQDSIKANGLEVEQFPAATVGGLLPFENFAIVRHGRFDNSDKARLATGLQAAVTWSSDLGPQVVLDNRMAVESAGDQKSQSIYEFELPRGKPRLRIVKLASAQQAQPGEVIDFTIRFDNIGDQVIGNVTVIDRLVTRLEYVDGSESSTVGAEFFTQENLGESMTLRWELTTPLKVGEGGVIRFQCRVR